MAQDTIELETLHDLGTVAFPLDDLERALRVATDEDGYVGDDVTVVGNVVVVADHPYVSVGLTNHVEVTDGNMGRVGEKDYTYRDVRELWAAVREAQQRPFEDFVLDLLLHGMNSDTRVVEYHQAELRLGADRDGTEYFLSHENGFYSEEVEELYHHDGIDVTGFWQHKNRLHIGLRDVRDE